MNWSFLSMCVHRQCSFWWKIKVISEVWVFVNIFLWILLFYVYETLINFVIWSCLVTLPGNTRQFIRLLIQLNSPLITLCITLMIASLPIRLIYESLICSIVSSFQMFMVIYRFWCHFISELIERDRPTDYSLMIIILSYR